ncbi:MAG TPA: hypothetical protein VFW86_02205, partial [Candidatus Limnocylindrales bacterium]|nr:hypothetical protein [Candidatus Limnocylindrales bacterium]
MTFLWPEALVLLLLAPLGVVLYRRLGRRRLAGVTARLGPGIRPTASPSGRPPRLRFRIPAVLVLAGLVV